MPEKHFEALEKEVEKFFSDYDNTCNAIEKALKTQLRNLQKVKRSIDKDKELVEMAKKHRDKWFSRRALEEIHAEYSCKLYLRIGADTVRIHPEQKIEVNISIMGEKI